MPAVKTLFSDIVSPETGKGDGISSNFRVHRKDGVTPGPVTIDYYGTWESVNLLIETCVDLAASPQNWAIEATKTSNGVYHFSPAQGTAVRCQINSSGSPLPSLMVKIRGDFDNQ